MANELREKIYINGVAIPKPPEFELEREDVYEATYTSMDGSIHADKTGWRYAETEFEWDALPQTAVAVLVALTGAFTLGFHNENNEFVEEQCYRQGSMMLPYRYKQMGVYWWKNPRMKVGFLNAHTD